MDTDKELKIISCYIPNTLNEIKTDIEIIIKKNEDIIKNYLEKTIYTSSISDSNKEILDIIFSKNKKLILDTF